MTHIQPNLASNMPAVTRVDLMARQNPAPKRAVAEYARSGLEDAMLRRMAELARQADKPKPAPAVEAKAVGKPSRMDASDVLRRLRGAICQTPKTAQELSSETGVPLSTVMARVRRMVCDGEAECQGQGRRKCGRLKPFVYAAVGTFANPVDPNATRQAPKKPGLRARVLAALSEPMAPFQVADRLKIGRGNARYQIQRLAEEGAVKPAGKVDTFRAKGIQQWVRT